MSKYKVQPDLELERIGQGLTHRVSANIKTDPEPEEDAEQTEFVVVGKDTQTAVIRVTRPFRRGWDLFTNLCALYTCISVPFVLAFGLSLSGDFNTIQSVIDFAFTLDICLNFFTTYIDRKGKEVLLNRKIVRKYLKGAFWFDIIATFPIDNIAAEIAPTSIFVQFLMLKDMLRLYRIPHFSRMIRFTHAADEVKAVLKLVVIVVYLLLVAHLFGCLWFIIVQRDKEHGWLPVPDFLSGETQVFEYDLWGQYSMVFYHSVWLLIGGEVGARNGLTAMCAASMITIGTVITAMLFGEMEVLAESLNRRQTQFQEAFDSALTTTKCMKLPKKTVLRILDYITSSQSQHNAQEEFETFMKFVSPSLRKEATAALYTPVIDFNPVLAGDDRLKKFLQQTMKTRFTQPEEEIISEGTKGDALYLVLNGKYSVTVRDRHKARHIVKHLEPGCLFGEIALVYDTVHTATVQSVGYGIVAQLLERDYEQMADLFPQIVARLRAQAGEYIDPWKDFITDTLTTIPFIRRLTESSVSELPYLMEFMKLEKGAYLFKPGDKTSKVYIVAEGQLELSVTINDKSLHLQKNRFLAGKEREPEPLHPRKRMRDIDYSQYEVPQEAITRLKAMWDISPVFKSNRIVGGVLQNEPLPSGLQAIGDYPQEIIIEELCAGTVIGEQSYAREDVAQIQCRVVKSAVVYVLRRDLIDSLKRYSSGGSITKAQTDIDEELNRPEEQSKRIILDYHYSGDGHLSLRRRWKSAILSVILCNRERPATGLTFITQMIPKLRAIMACENVGNFILAAKVGRDEVPPHHIMEDGTLDPTVMNPFEGPYASLPRSHPIMKVFRKASAAIIDPAGEMLREFSRLGTTMQDKKSELKSLRKDANFLHYTLLKVLNNLSGGKEDVSQMAVKPL